VAPLAVGEADGEDMAKASAKEEVKL